MTEMNPKEQRGKEIALRNDLKRVDVDRYEVRSMDHKIVYDIISTEQGWVCTCPDHTFRKVKCKHIFSVEYSIKLQQDVKEKNSVTIKQLNQNICIFCNSSNIVKHGIRHNKNYDLQRFSCRDCKRRFSFNLGFEKMKATPQIITSTMQLYFSGESLRNVQKFLKLQGIEISHVAVYKWIKKYVNLMESYLEKLTPQVSDKWRADELFFKVKGNPKYLYALMDDETRFWIAKQVSDEKFTADVRPMFRDGVKVAKKQPSTLITDGAHNFKVGFRKEYWTLRNPRAIHIRHIHIKGDMNNNKMERLNGEIRDREKVMRGLKKTDSPIITGYQIYHNYFRSHMALDGKTPAEKCGIKIEGENKWLTLIQNATNNHKVISKSI